MSRWLSDPKPPGSSSPPTPQQIGGWNVVEGAFVLVVAAGETVEDEEKHQDGTTDRDGYPDLCRVVVTHVFALSEGESVYRCPAVDKFVKGCNDRAFGCIFNGR